MTDEVSLPEFAVAMRGYDRLQVDEYIVRQAGWLQEAQARRQAAEEELVAGRTEVAQLRDQLAGAEKHELTGTPRSLEELGERVGRILQMAWDAAEELRAEAKKTAAEMIRGAEERLSRAEEEYQRKVRHAEEQAGGVVAEVREKAAREAAALVEEAERERAAMLDRAREEAKRLTDEAGRRAEDLQAEVTTLNDHRQLAMADLARLRARIEAFLTDPAERGQGGDAAIDLRREEDTPPNGSPASPKSPPGAWHGA